MYGQLSLVKSADDTYDLCIDYDRHDSEFAMDFLAKARVRSSYASIASFLNTFARNVNVRKVRIMSGPVTLGTLPIEDLQLSPSGGRQVLAYLSRDAAGEAHSLVEQAGGVVSTVSPGWLTVDGNGGLQCSIPGKSALAALKAQNVRVVPFLCNYWNRQAGVRALENAPAIARKLATLANANGWDGIHLNLENLTPMERNKYVHFVREVRRALGEEKELSVAVAANPDGWNWGWQGSYDYKNLARWADYLVLMTWDQHMQGGKPGPVAGTDHVERSLRFALQSVKPEKLAIGLPLYGRVWSESGQMDGQSVPLWAVEEFLATHAPLVLTDPYSKSPKAVFTVEKSQTPTKLGTKTLPTGRYALWFENTQSIRAKLAMAERYDLCGCAFWSLGQQSTGIWSAVQNTLAPDTIPVPLQAANLAVAPSPSLPVKAAPALPSDALCPTAQVISVGAALLRTPEEKNAITTLQSGVLVRLLSNHGEHYKVQLLHGEIGYMPSHTLCVHKIGVVLSAAGARILSAPNGEGKPIAHLPFRGALTILEERGQWCKVRLADKRIGYTALRRLALTEIDRPIHIVAATADLKLRSAPTPDSDTLGTLPTGERALLLSADTAYTHISLGGVTAYVTEGYLENI